MPTVAIPPAPVASQGERGTGLALRRLLPVQINRDRPDAARCGKARIHEVYDVCLNAVGQRVNRGDHRFRAAAEACAETDSRAGTIGRKDGIGGGIGIRAAHIEKGLKRTAGGGKAGGENLDRGVLQSADRADGQAEIRGIAGRRASAEHDAAVGCGVVGIILNRRIADHRGVCRADRIVRIAFETVPVRQNLCARRQSQQAGTARQQRQNELFSCKFAFQKRDRSHPRYIRE